MRTLLRKVGVLFVRGRHFMGLGGTATYFRINNGIIVCLRHVGVAVLVTPIRLIDDGVSDAWFGVTLRLCAATDGG